jgi:hypothetical protein
VNPEKTGLLRGRKRSMIRKYKPQQFTTLSLSLPVLFRGFSLFFFRYFNFAFICFSFAIFVLLLENINNKKGFIILFSSGQHSRRMSYVLAVFPPPIFHSFYFLSIYEKFT